MKTLYVVAMLAATLAGGTLESASAQSASKTGIKNAVFGLPVKGCDLLLRGCYGRSATLSRLDC